MAITYVGGTTGSGTGASYSIDLTALTGGSDSSPSTGDLIIIACGWASTANATVAPPIGYGLLSDLYVNDTRDANLGGFFRIVGSTPDTTVTVPGANNAARGGATSVHVWRGVDTTQPFDVLLNTATGTDSAYVNCPTITPTTSGAYVLALGLATGDTAPTAMTGPSGMSNFVTQIGTGSTMSAISGISSFAWSTGAYDPAAWTGGESTTSDSWAGITIALRPIQSDPDLEANTLAYYKLDESSGNAADATGNGYTLTNTNTVGYASGIINNGADFSSSNTNKTLRSTSLPDPDSYNAGFSIDFWVNFYNTPSAYDSCSYQDSSWSGIQSIFINATTFLFRFGNGVVSDGGSTTITIPSVSTSTWYYVAICHTATANIAYINNDMIGGRANAVTLSGNGTGFSIGGNYANVNYSSSKIDEVGIYSTGMSVNNRTARYNGGAGNQYPFISSDIKTVDGLAFADVKTINGLAVADIQNINGLE